MRAGVPQLPISVDVTRPKLYLGDCSHEIRRQLLLGRKVMTNLDSILKSIDITLYIKVHIVKGMYGLPSSHIWM